MSIVNILQDTIYYIINGQKSHIVHKLATFISHKTSIYPLKLGQLSLNSYTSSPAQQHIDK